MSQRKTGTKTATSPKGGRPLKAITDDHLRQIEVLAGYGLTEAAIAHIIGVSPATFRRRKEDTEAVVSALEKGKALAEQQVAEALFNKAKSGDLGAIVWWEKTRAGRTDRQSVDFEGRVQIIVGAGRMGVDADG